MTYLSIEDLLRIHSALIDETGGSHGIRDHHAFATLGHLPKQSAFGKELYPSIFGKAAVYVRNIIFGHLFIDGNTRTAMAAADVFLQLNGYRIAVSEGGVEKVALSMIEQKLSLDDISSWLKKNSRKIGKDR